ncbi:hypothetical protein L208DRAFT_1413433 [Tricholoma matsutake]|nr:hypothetical protein L208DRAFT_1413433 [Tricholoma matsutake 945]
MAENISNETVERTLGALLLGNLAAAILYGVTCIQTYIYYRKNYKDTPVFRFLIFFLWLLDGLHLAFISHASYYYLVSNFTNISAAASPTWSILIQICLTLITNGLIRTVFGRRVWLLTKGNLVLVGCIAIASGLTFTTGFAYATRAFAPFYSQISILTDILCDFQQIYSRNFQTLVADIVSRLCLLWKRSGRRHYDRGIPFYLSIPESDRVRKDRIDDQGDHYLRYQYLSSHNGIFRCVSHRVRRLARFPHLPRPILLAQFTVLKQSPSNTKQSRIRVRDIRRCHGRA